MLALRQQARGLMLLGQLLQRQSAHPATASHALWQLQAAAALHRSPGWLAATDKLGAIAGWLAERMPTSLGGSKDGDLDFETFASHMTQARRLGALSGFVHGTSAIKDGSVQGTMRQFEAIIKAMRPEEKKALALFDRDARRRVADEAGCTTSQVDDCIARFLWTRQMTRKLHELRKAGREIPTDIGELERLLGTWRQYKSEHEAGDGASSGGVPLGHVGHKGQPCPLAGAPVGKNTRCPATRKAFKACCGKSLKLG